MKIYHSLVIAAFCCFALACNSPKEEKSDLHLYEASVDAPVDLVKKGEKMVNTMGCHHCHSPKMMTEKGPIVDPNRMLSGHPAEAALAPYDGETAKAYVLFTMDLTATIGPWGTSFAANLTPDDTGIGTWTEDQFIYALRNGKFKGLEGSRGLLPPMPWEDFSKLTDEELKAIYAYLMSIPPVNNLVPTAIINPPPG